MALNRRHFFESVAMAIGAAQLDLSDTTGARRPSPEFAAIGRAPEWLNSPRLTPDALVEKVVLIQFCTYTCINWLRTLSRFSAVVKSGDNVREQIPKSYRPWWDGRRILCRRVAPLRRGVWADRRRERSDSGPGNSGAWRCARGRIADASAIREKLGEDQAHIHSFHDFYWGQFVPERQLEFRRNRSVEKEYAELRERSLQRFQDGTFTNYRSTAYGAVYPRAEL
jgi:hypothetical protein